MTTSSLGTLDFLKQWGVSREACLFESNTSFDVTLVCHEARSVDVSHGDQLFVSVRVAQKVHAEEARAAIGAACQLKAVDVDTNLLLCLWAARDEASSRDEARRRACGELHIPLHRLATHFDGMLYQTWVTLDLPGLNDSVASIGFGGEDGAFDQRLAEGARQNLQPRICLSICKTSELPASGKLLLQVDAADASRERQWGPLLKSQQQHSVLSKVLHLQLSTAVESPDAVEQTARTTSKLREVQDRAAAQRDDLAQVRRSLEEANARLADERTAASRSSDGPLTEADGKVPPPFQEHGRASADGASAAQTARRQAEVERLREESAKVSLEANQKIDAANERIRTLRRERDEARAEAERTQQEVKQLNDHQAELQEETHQLSQQIQDLLKIVEDLHDSCVGSGQDYLDNMRQSIDSITKNFQFR
ncbi:unnamed protein product [Prorocentrum cordatum]|uniref:Uncharacterized protein n=1 Tax=Prorocentrum cordatum TaxID=2364126 RepID=A0ABN9PPI0_9DINO|nr:unnamed protein product [Polarella glacialis]